MKNYSCFYQLNKHLLRMLLALLPFASVVTASAAEYFVGPTGKDTNPGTRAKPFATLERARDEIRKLKLAGPLSKPVQVLLRAGVYELPQTFQLGPEDSGAASTPVVYRAYGKEKATLSGGRTVSDWQPYKGRILKADMGIQGLKDVSFRQLFCDSKRQVLARYPNFDSGNPVTGGWLYVDGDLIPMYKNIENESRRTFQYKAGDFHQWSLPGEVEVMVFPRYNWWNSLVSISSIDRSNRVITLAENAAFSIRPNDRYYFQNALQELDSPGEWYLDRKSGTLYFWPPADVSSVRVCVPALQTLIMMKGAQFVSFRGLILECADGTAVILEDCDHCLIAGSTIRNVGSRAIRYLEAGISILGGTHNGAIGNDIYEVGGAGISLSGGNRETLAPAENYADNNWIHHTGVYCKQGVGVNINGVGNRISHNLIHDCPSFGILWNGNDHVIEFNHVHHIALETDDGGAIYCFQVDWTKRGTEIRYNFVHDVIGFGQTDGKWTRPHMNWGIYLDDGTCGTHVFGNIVARTVTGGVHVHGGRDNMIENNILLDATETQMIYNGYLTGMHPVPMMTETWKKFSGTPVYEKYPGYHELTISLENAWQMAGNKFLRNIICYTNPKATLYAAWGPRENLQISQTESDYNLIWHDDLPPSVKVWWLKNPGNLEWSEWKKLGFEQHSALADPLFVNRASDDYRLKPGSPAFTMGFKTIPVSKIGLYKDPNRASWPVGATGL